MKKNLFAALMLVSFSAFSYAQQKGVGINTTTPAATLDVVATTTDNTIPDAVLVPRMSENELAAKNNAYLAAQNGALTFITAVDGSTTPKTVNVTAVGFYYYDSTSSTWKAVGGGGSAIDTSIYTDNGTLNSNRTVTQGANTLTFTSSSVNGFSVDGTTLSVDAANNRIGVGTSAPQQPLHVEGVARITGSGATPTTLTGRDVNGDIGNIIVGTGLSLTAGTLSAVVAGGYTYVAQATSINKNESMLVTTNVTVAAPSVATSVQGDKFRIVDATGGSGFGVTGVHPSTQTTPNASGAALEYTFISGAWYCTSQ